MVIEDLTMLANLPVAAIDSPAKAGADKAAASDTMPPATHTHADDADETDAGRLARRGQDPPEPEKAAEEDS